LITNFQIMVGCAAVICLIMFDIFCFNSYIHKHLRIFLYTNITPWCRVLEKPKFFGHSGNSQHFTEHEGSLPCSQDRATGRYPCLTSGPLPSGFPTKTLYAVVFCPMRVTSPAHLILLDLIILITYDEQYKL
jgi:hypothetical protein